MYSSAETPMTSTSISRPLRMNLGFKKGSLRVIGSPTVRRPRHEYNDGPPEALYGPIGCRSVADGPVEAFGVSQVAETLRRTARGLVAGTGFEPVT